MESISNCDLFVDIEVIQKVVGKDQCLEINADLADRTQCVLRFEAVWDYRCCIEAACIDRFSRFQRRADNSSSVLVVKDSDYLKYFKAQAVGTRPTDSLTEYIVFDKIDTVVSVLSGKKPYIIQHSSKGAF